MPRPMGPAPATTKAKDGKRLASGVMGRVCLCDACVADNPQRQAARDKQNRDVRRYLGTKLKKFEW